MDYYSIEVQCREEHRSILIALLSDTAVEAFEERSEGFSAYVPQQGRSEALEASLADWKQRFDFSYDWKHWPDKNWNAIWEADYQPVVVDGFCQVRAPYHPRREDLPYEIVIQPQMSFGTGHHATTKQMMQAMQALPWPQEKVMDIGCGTGVLAILASLLGAKELKALDNDEWAYDNTLSNMKLNGVDNIEVCQGVLETCFVAEPVDVLLANINTNVLLALIPQLSDYSHPGSYLLISGFLEKDAATIASCSKKHWDIIAKQSKEGWCCWTLQRRA